MTDGSLITMTNMSKKTTTETTEVNKDVDAEATDTEMEKEETEDAEEGTEESKESDEAEDDADAGKEDTDKSEIDYDAEIDAEKKRGKPDPKKAVEAFKERTQKREGDEDGEDDENKPLTRKDLAEVEIRVERKLLKGQALSVAKGLADNDKEAELIVARWGNRSFPQGTPLSEQIEEVYAALPHVRKRLIGERNEALRALKGKEGANRNSATTHKAGLPGKEPKLSPQDEQAIKAAGFVFNATARWFEKKLGNGDLLVRDPKTKQTRLVKKAK